MSNLVTLRTEVLSFLNRTAAELGDDVDNIINGAIIFAQRKHKFKYSERLIRFTYPANSDSVDITAACDGTPRDFISLQVGDSSSFSVGRSIQFKNYLELIADRNKYERRQTDYSYPIANSVSDSDSSHASFTTDVNRLIAFIINKNIGLYPRPTTDIYCLLNLHIWLGRVSADADTNFLFDYAYDYLLLLTLRRANLFLKVDSRFNVTDAEVEKAWESVVAWDGEVSNYPMMTNV